MKNRIVQIILLTLFLVSSSVAVCLSADKDKTTSALLGELEKRADYFNPDPEYRDDR
jgi:hypothetical protein